MSDTHDMSIKEQIKWMKYLEVVFGFTPEQSNNFMNDNSEKMKSIQDISVQEYISLHAGLID